MARERRRLHVRLLWFAALWVAGVTAVGLLSLMVRALLGR